MLIRLSVLLHRDHSEEGVLNKANKTRFIIHRAYKRSNKLTKKHTQTQTSTSDRIIIREVTTNSPIRLTRNIII